MKKPTDTQRLDKLERIERIANGRRWYWIGKRGRILASNDRTEAQGSTVFKTVREAIDAAPEPR